MSIQKIKTINISKYNVTGELIPRKNNIRIHFSVTGISQSRKTILVKTKFIMCEGPIWQSARTFKSFDDGNCWDSYLFCVTAQLRWSTVIKKYTCAAQYLDKPLYRYEAYFTNVGVLPDELLPLDYWL